MRKSATIIKKGEQQQRLAHKNGKHIKEVEVYKSCLRCQAAVIF